MAKVIKILITTAIVVSTWPLISEKIEENKVVAGGSDGG